MPDNPKSLARVPVIPLSYDEKDRAVAKELVADYETGNIYIKNSNGEFINVFQAALKVDNQWITASARLNNGRAWNVTAGSANNALVAAGTNSNGNGASNSNIKAVDSVEAWDGSTWKVDTIEDFGVNSISNKRYVGGCGTRDSMLFARTNGVYKYENTTATLLTSSGVLSNSFDVCGNSTQALFREFTGKVFIFNSITKTFTSLGTITNAAVKDTLSEESFGGVNGAIILGNHDTSRINYTVKYDGNTFTTLISPNIYRNRFGSAGENTTSGIIFGGCTDSGITNQDYIASANLSSITNTTEEWINGTTWKISSNMEYALAALDGCGTAQGGIAMGGFLNDGSISTYTERFSNVDGLSYLKSIRDDMSAVIDAISDKTIGSTFDSFLTTNSSVAANSLIGMPGIGTKQEKATIATLDRIYSYSRLTKSLTALESFMTLLEGPPNFVFTSGVSDDVVDYVVDQNANNASKRNGVTSSTISFNPFYLSNATYNQTSIESTGLQSGIGRKSHSSNVNATYFKYDFDALTISTLSIKPLISRAGGFGAGNQALAYFAGGKNHSSSLYYLNAEKIANNTVASIGNTSAYHFTVYGGQANMMKYGNDYIIYGNVIEKLNTLTDTWSTENYRSSYTSDFCAANGNTAAFGLGAAIVSGAGACFEELYHGGVLETIENLLSENSTNMNTEKAEKVELGTDVNIEYVAGTKDGTATTILVNTEQFFKILCEDTDLNIPDYTDSIGSELIYTNAVSASYLYEDDDGTQYYEAYIDDNLELSDSTTMGNRIRTLENILIYIIFGSSPALSRFGYIGEYEGENVPGDEILSNYNMRNELLEYLISTYNSPGGLANLISNHTNGAHPNASSSRYGYMSTSHYNLLSNASYSDYSGSTLVKRSSGKFYSGTPSYAASSYYVVNCTYVYNYFIRNSSAQNSPSTLQILGTMLQAAANTNYTQRQVRNIVFWTSGAIPTTQNGDIIIKTF